MNPLKLCTDCLHCKIITSKSLLRCSQDQWTYDNDGSEKLVRLTKDETRETELNIRYRNIFQKAQRCPLYNP